MRLSKYIKHRGDTADLARRLGVAHVTVARWRDGKAIPSRDLMIQLAQATGGRVAPADFYRRSRPAPRRAKGPRK